MLARHGGGPACPQQRSCLSSGTSWAGDLKQLAAMRAGRAAPNRHRALSIPVPAPSISIESRSYALVDDFYVPLYGAGV